MKTLSTVLVSLLTSCTLLAQINEPVKSKLTGSWEGGVNFQGITLTLVLNVTTNPNDHLDATLDSPDQGAYGIHTNGVEQEGGHYVIRVPTVGGRLKFDYVDSTDQWDGTWSQGGQDWDITLTRMTKEKQAQRKKELERPQEPKRPFPYVEKEVKFENPEAGIELAGTLTLPDTVGQYPAAVLITGSGPENRDEEVFGHKPFLVIADYLTRYGIAVLRYDDRGTAESGGNFKDATTVDFASDALSAVDFLLKNPHIDTNLIGLVGHSEGGIVAPMAANLDPSVHFVILIAGPAVSGDTIIMEQTRLMLKRSGNTDQETIDKQTNLQQAIFVMIRKGKQLNWAKTRLQDSVANIYQNLSSGEKELLGLNDNAIPQYVNQITSPWMQYFLTHDPRKDLRKLDIPVLAIFGEKDFQVPPSVTKEPMEKVLQQAPTNDFEVVVFKELNHLMQHSDTGLVTEYQKISETFAPEVLDKMATWIKDHSNKK